MERLRQRAKKYRELAKEHAENPDAPAVADEDGDGEHAEWNKSGYCFCAKTSGSRSASLKIILTDTDGMKAC